MNTHVHSFEITTVFKVTYTKLACDGPLVLSDQAGNNRYISTGIATYTFINLKILYLCNTHFVSLLDGRATRLFQVHVGVSTCTYIGENIAHL